MQRSNILPSDVLLEVDTFLLKVHCLGNLEPVLLPFPLEAERLGGGAGLGGSDEAGALAQAGAPSLRPGKLPNHLKEIRKEEGSQVVTAAQ